jgi:hypothetical protein
MAHQIVAANASLTEGGIGCRAAGCYDDGRYTTVKYVESVVKSRSQHRGWPPGIFGGAKDDDGVSWMDFLKRSGVHNLNGCDCQEQNDCGYGQQQETKPPAGMRRLIGGVIGHSLNSHP